jgi:DNA-binding transcriptional regulator YiaG
MRLRDASVTPTIHELRTSLGLTTGAVARLCGVDRRTVQRWLDGSQDVSQPAYRLLLACERFPAVLEWLQKD